MFCSVIRGHMWIQRAAQSVNPEFHCSLIVHVNSEILGWQLNFYSQWQQWFNDCTITSTFNNIFCIIYLQASWQYRYSGPFMIQIAPQTKSLRSPVCARSWCRTCSCWPPPPSSCSVSPAPGTRAGWFLPARTWSWRTILFQTIVQLSKNLFFLFAC